MARINRKIWIHKAKPGRGGEPHYRVFTEIEAISAHRGGLKKGDREIGLRYYHQSILAYFHTWMRAGVQDQKKYSDVDDKAKTEAKERSLCLNSTFDPPLANSEADKACEYGFKFKKNNTKPFPRKTTIATRLGVTPDEVKTLKLQFILPQQVLDQYEKEKQETKTTKSEIREAIDKEISMGRGDFSNIGNEVSERFGIKITRNRVYERKKAIDKKSGRSQQQLTEESPRILGSHIQNISTEMINTTGNPQHPVKSTQYAVKNSVKNHNAISSLNILNIKKEKEKSNILRSCFLHKSNPVKNTKEPVMEIKTKQPVRGCEKCNCTEYVRVGGEWTFCECRDRRKGCDLCDWTGYRIKKKERVLCECWTKRKVARYLLPLGPFEFPGVEVLEQIKNLDSTKNIYFLWDERNKSKVMGLFCYLLLQRGLIRTYRLLNVFDLLEILFGKHALTDSVLKLMMDVLILTSGYGEAENKIQGEMILQTLENRSFYHKTTWYFHKGRKDKFPSIISYATKNDFEIVNLCDLAVNKLKVKL